MSNSGFSNIKNVAGQFTDIYATNVVASNIDADQDVGAKTLTLGGVTYGTVVGYLPNATLPLAIGAYTLTKTTGSAVVTSGTLSSASPVTIPVGARVVRVRYFGINSYASTATLDIGCGALNTDAGPMVPEFITAGTTALANQASGGCAQSTATAFGAVGTSADLPLVTANNYLNVSVIGATVTAGGLKVIVEYEL
jgi:hypothetical protein